MADQIMESAKDMINYINNSPSPFHAVSESSKRLIKNGYIEVDDTKKWNLKRNGKYFITRNHSAMIAFTVGGRYEMGNGFSVMAAHTDSPVIKIKPVSMMKKHGFNMTAIECYGGGIWPSWLDRDLKIAGRVYIKNGDSIEPRLLDINRPVARIPNICVHMQRDSGTKIDLNKEQNLNAIISSVLTDEMNSPSAGGMAKVTGGQTDKHCSSLLSAIAKQLDVKPDQILDFELNFSDFVPATLGGMSDEYIFSPRLDNQHSCYCGIQAMINASDSIKDDVNIRMLALFDNEEVGSKSPQGAGSAFIEQTMLRICDSTEHAAPSGVESGCPAALLARSIPASYLLSADMAHAVHPNYADKHEERHRVELQKGIVIKINSNQKYASTSYSITIMKELAKKANVPVQDFMIRQDTVCGGTVGPTLAAKLNISTIDMGAPQLSMHSLREMCDTIGVDQSIRLYQKFFEDLPTVVASMKKSIS